MRLFLVSLMIALLTVPAAAQKMGRGKQHQPTDQRSAEQKKKSIEGEKAYKATLDKIPVQKYDPWQRNR